MQQKNVKISEELSNAKKENKMAKSELNKINLEKKGLQRENEDKAKKLGQLQLRIGDKTLENSQQAQKIEELQKTLNKTREMRQSDQNDLKACKTELEKTLED